jgi:hypothetical protein
MLISTLAVTGAERVNAIHREFAGRTTYEMLGGLLYLLLGLGALIGVLVLVNYLQNRIFRHAAAQHRAQLEAKLRRPAPPRPHS